MVTNSELRSFLNTWFYGIIDNFESRLKVDQGELNEAIRDLPDKLREIYTPEKIEYMVEKTFQEADLNKDGKIDWNEWQEFNKKDGMAESFGKIHQLFFAE